MIRYAGLKPGLFVSIHVFFSSSLLCLFLYFATTDKHR